MATKFNWTCPYCSRDSTITDSNYSSSVHSFDKDSKDGHLGVITEVTTCPNNACKEYTIVAALRKARYNPNFQLYGESLLTWKLRPQSFAIPLPDYVPEPVKNDYEEACLIRDLSPKASATLSRRCLQGVIRDYWGISKSRLVDEINAIEEKVDPITWKAIDSVRSIGNIGAHMEKDIDLVIDVDPEEAQLLIGLIEILIKDWYIARHERQKHLEKIIGVAGKKAEQKKSNTSSKPMPNGAA